MRALKVSFLPTVALAAVLSLALARPCAAQLAPTDLGVLDGCTDSFATAINSKRQIVGYCAADWDADGALDVEVPFVWQNGTMTALPLEGYSAGVAWDINASGQIVGTCDFQACLWTPTDAGWEVEGLAPAGCTNSSASMINDLGHIVVQCGNAYYHRDSQGTMTELKAEGVPILPWQMNASGQVVGRLGGGEDVVLWSPGGAVTPLVPNIEQQAWINDLGQVVGTYFDSDPGADPDLYAEANFLYLPEAAYDESAGVTTWLVGSEGRFVGVNNAGQVLVVGPQTTDGTDIQLIDFKRRVLFEGTASGKVSELGVAMNGNGLVAGSVEVDAGGNTNGFFWIPGTDVEPLGGLGGSHWGALGLNDSGMIFGYATLGDGHLHACMWMTSYSWSGFLQPIDPPGPDGISASVFKAGSTVPVKFALTGTSAGITGLEATLTAAKESDGVVGTAIEAAATSAATTGNLFRYDAASGQYVFNWSTKGLGKGSYKLTVNMGDDVDRTVTISLR